MSNYIGVRCPVCNKKFTNTDDIVVCPVCGAPHHRACYAEKGACAFVSDHLSGKEWRAPAPDPQHNVVGESANDVVACPLCNSANPKGVIFCQVCGNRINEIPPQRPAMQGQNKEGWHPMWGFPPFMPDLDPVTLMYGGVSPDDKIDDESVRDLAVYIGDNSAYYLPRFQNMYENTRTLSFNFSALLFNFMYFFYRKMYAIGAAMFVLFIIGAIPSVLQAREMLPQVLNYYLGSSLPVNYAAISHYQSLVNTASTINFFICLIISFCANKFYYMKVVTDVKNIRESKVEPHDAIAYNKALSEKGGISKTAVIVVIAVIIVAYFAVGFVLAYENMKLGGLFIR